MVGIAQQRAPFQALVTRGCRRSRGVRRMTELADRTTSLDPLPRCCPAHRDWPELTQHLVDDFPEIPLRDVVREVARARDATTTASLEGADALETGEVIARHQPMLMAGRLEDVARLDPERHARRPAWGDRSGRMG